MKHKDKVVNINSFNITVLNSDSEDTVDITVVLERLNSPAMQIESSISKLEIENQLFDIVRNEEMELVNRIIREGIFY